MNKQELIDYCNAIKENKSQIINCIDVNGIIKKIEQLDEQQKVTVPQFVADWIEEAKKEGYSIFGAINKAPKGEVEGWIELQNVEIFAEAWVNGYEVEKEKWYTVKMRATKQPLFYNNMYEKIFFSLGELATRFTRKELEGAGLGWVFDCPGVEVEEVTE